MGGKKREHPKEKESLHIRNRHRERYDFKKLIASCQELAGYVRLNEYNDESIDFADPEAVKVLNRALLMHFYGIGYWEIPSGYLCPPIPGRADYIHYMADLLASLNSGRIPVGEKIRCLDIGVGANCVYPIIGNHEYGWSFKGSETDPVAIGSARKIVRMNPALKDQVELWLQADSRELFNSIVEKDDKFDLTVCNPPFHSSPDEAISASLRKVSNLKGKKITAPVRNFGGSSNELWCEGGESRFIRDMVFQSRKYSESVFWFSTVVSKRDHLKSIYTTLKKAEVVEVKTIPMGQGNKSTRVVAWTFLSPESQKSWIKARWND